MRNASPLFRVRPRPALVALGLLAIAVAVASFGSPPRSIGAGRSDVRILGSDPSSLDPIEQSDVGSAQVIAQLFETLTAVDAAQHVEPALARSWDTLDGGTRVVFHLRSGLTFSDGEPLGPSEVVASWMRLLSPTAKAPLASLLDDVTGAADYRKGRGSKDAVGLHALNSTDVEVLLLRPAADLPAIASSPSLAIVPPGLDGHPSMLVAGSFVGSGGYVLSQTSSTELTLTANTRYWAGPPAIRTVHLVTDTGGKGLVATFQAGGLDYTPVATYDALWLAYDKTLGPSLRQTTSATTDFYGFDTSKPPFSDVHVRRAFRLGIDWRRLVSLVDDPAVTPATSMVPPGIPGRSETNFGPVFDLAQARAELALAGYPNGRGFPKVTLITGGSGYDAAVIRQVRDNLGIDLSSETLDFDSYLPRLTSDPPAMWEMSWVADYPGADDFLGLLLGTGKENNWGRWSSPAFDAAIDHSLSAPSQNVMQAGFDQAQAVVRDDAPVIPVSNSSGYALAAPGLLGATPNAMGLMRFAGLAWAQ